MLGTSVAAEDFRKKSYYLFDEKKTYPFLGLLERFRTDNLRTAGMGQVRQNLGEITQFLNADGLSTPTVH